MQWIPIDRDNLYTQEVLAINTSHNMLVGYLEAIEGDGDHVCCTDRQPGSFELFHATHYIPATELVELVKRPATTLEEHESREQELVYAFVDFLLKRKAEFAARMLKPSYMAYAAEFLEERRTTKTLKQTMMSSKKTPEEIKKAKARKRIASLLGLPVDSVTDKDIEFLGKGLDEIIERKTKEINDGQS